jgi:hypothetical protein
MNLRNQSILARFGRYEHPKTADLTKAAENCLTIAEQFANQRELLERDGYLTPQGKRARLTEALTKQFARDMRDARAPIEAAAKDIERLRGNIKPVAVDHTDIVAAMARAEMRAYIRGLSSKDQIEALLKRSDPRILDAVLDPNVAAEVSGVPEQHFAAAKAAREQILFGDQLREIEALQAVVDEANAAATIARTDLAAVVEMDQSSFDALVTPIEKKSAAPWLLRQGDRTVVVVPGETTYRDATEDQLREGKFYAGMQEYQQDRAA